MSKLMTIWRIGKGSISAKLNGATGSWPWHKKIHCVWIFLIFLITFGFEFGIILMAIFFEMCASGKLPIITDLIESIFLYYSKFHYVNIQRDYESLILTRIEYILVTKLDLNMIPFIWAVPWEWTEISRAKFYSPDYSTLELLYTSTFDSIHENLGLSRDLNLKYIPVPLQFQVDGKLVNFDLIGSIVSFMVALIRVLLSILFIPFYLLGKFIYSYIWFANKKEFIEFTMLLALSLPMANCWILSSFGRKIGVKGAKFITFISLGLSVLLSISGFHLIVVNLEFVWINLGTWITSGDFNVDWSFVFDTLSVSMFFVVNTVSFVVHVYSFEYMKDDPHQIRFLALLSFFTAFMLILVSADNFLVLFFGWEGIGVCSYLLINFWFHRIQANKSSIKALLMNRVGDFALLLGIIWIFVVTKTVDFDSLFVILHFVASDVFLVLSSDYSYLQPLFSTWECIALLLFIGAMGKSAQIGLHTWLPDAMEGPTPVSALIHAATLVTAGVYLILRCSRIFEIAENVSSLMVFIGSMTTFFAATAGLVQYDIKKVIAYSTCSQLGYMITSCGVNNYAASFFHLINHAFFKALLFLAAGAVIHGLGNEQDMRRMGGLRHIMPLTYVMILIGSLSLMGFPFFSGFYSKDIILESIFVKSSLHMWNNPLNLELGAYIFGTISAGLTAFYSFRLIYLVFISEASGHRVRMLSAHEMPFTMAAPLTILCFGSIYLGFGFKDMFTGTGTPIYNNSLVLSNTNVFCEGVPYIAKIAPVVVSMIAICFYWILYVTESFDSYLSADKNSTTSDKFKKEVFNFLSLRWYFDIVQNLFVVKPVLKLSFTSLFKDLDKGLLHMFGPVGIVRMISILFSSTSTTYQRLSIIHNLLCSMILLYLSIFFLSDIYLSFPNN